MLLQTPVPVSPAGGGGFKMDRKVAGRVDPQGFAEISPLPCAKIDRPGRQSLLYPVVKVEN